MSIHSQGVKYIIIVQGGEGTELDHVNNFFFCKDERRRNARNEAPTNLATVGGMSMGKDT